MQFTTNKLKTRPPTPAERRRYEPILEQVRNWCGRHDPWYGLKVMVAIAVDEHGEMLGAYAYPLMEQDHVLMGNTLLNMGERTWHERRNLPNPDPNRPKRGRAKKKPR